MQAKNGDGARRTVWDVLQYLITIPDVKEAIKEDGSKFKLQFALDGIIKSLLLKKVNI